MVQINQRWDELKNCSGGATSDNKTNSTTSSEKLPLSEIKLKDDLTNAHVATCKEAPGKDGEKGEKKDEKNETTNVTKTEKPKAPEDPTKSRLDASKEAANQAHNGKLEAEKQIVYSKPEPKEKGAKDAEKKDDAKADDKEGDKKTDAKDGDKKEKKDATPNKAKDLKDKK